MNQNFKKIFGRLKIRCIFVEENKRVLQRNCLGGKLDSNPSVSGFESWWDHKRIKMRYIILDDDVNCEFLIDELTSEIEDKIKEGYYRVIDLETLEVIVSNKNGLFRRKINKY